MAAFIIRRLVGMVLVLLAVSFIVFLIFIVVPGGDPAQRIAGKVCDDEQNIANIRQDWGFDQAVPVQYYDHDEEAFTGELVSYTNQTNVVTRSSRGCPATFSLAIGAAIIWFGFWVLVGAISAVTAGRISDRAITVLALIGISLPVVLARPDRSLLPRRGRQDDVRSRTAATSR